MDSRAIDRITAHWKSTKGSRGGPVAGFGGAVEIWWSPWTLGENDAVFGAFEIRKTATGVSMPPALFARCLVVKAEDKDGNRLFAPADETELLAEADSKEVTRLALAIIADLNKGQAVANDGAGSEGEGGPKA